MNFFNVNSKIFFRPWINLFHSLGETSTKQVIVIIHVQASFEHYLDWDHFPWLGHKLISPIDTLHQSKPLFSRFFLTDEERITDAWNGWSTSMISIAPFIHLFVALRLHLSFNNILVITVYIFAFYPLPFLFEFLLMANCWLF